MRQAQPHLSKSSPNEVTFANEKHMVNFEEIVTGSALAVLILEHAAIALEDGARFDRE
jgi:hypothetical protein